MLVCYEIELNAYHLVLQCAQDYPMNQAIPWDIESNVRRILATPVARAEAEAMYAPFFALLQELTPENLEMALAAIRRRIAEYEANILPNKP